MMIKQQKNRFHFPSASWLFLAVLLGTIFPRYALAEEVTVTFEEGVPFPDSILSQYCYQGVDFISTARIITPSVVTSSPTHVLTNLFPSGEFGEGNTIRASFTVAQSSVSVRVGLDRTHSTAVEARLWGFSSDTPQQGFLVDIDTISLGAGPTPITQTLTVTASPANIKSIMIEFIRPTNLQVYEWVDDLTFTKGPPCGVIDTTPPIVFITRPAVGGTVTHTHSNRLAYTIQDDHSVAQVQVVFTDENNVELDSFFSCGGPNVPPCWDPLESENGDYYTSLPDGTKRIWVKAWDYANNEGKVYRSLDLQLPGPNVNLWAEAIEITQGVQPWLPQNQTKRSSITPVFSYPAVTTGYTGVPLVAGRKTVVRLFAGIENSNNNIPLTGSTAELRCYNSFSHQPCPGPQKAMPEFDAVAFPSGLTLDPSDTLDDRRRNEDLSFNFILPRQWTTSGDIYLEAEVFPPGDVSECTGCDDRANRVRVTDIHFYKVPGFSDKLGHLVMIERTLGTVKTTPTQANIDRAAEFIRNIYPVDETTISTKNTKTVPLKDFDHTTFPQAQQGQKLNERCNSVRTKLRETFPHKKGRMSVNALIDINFPCAGIGGGGYSFSNERDSAIVAHEMGHTVGLPHAGPRPGHSSFCPNPNGSDCAECRPSPGGCDADFPYPHGNIGAYGFNVFDMTPIPNIHADCVTPGTCDNGLNEDGDFWMSDTDGDGVLEPVFAKIDDDPAGRGGTDLTNHPHDFMSYGNFSDWISPRNWTRLFNAFTNSNLPYPANPPQASNAATSLATKDLAADFSSTRVLMVGGRLDERLGWQLDPAFEMEYPESQTAGMTGEYFVRLLDNSGNVLVEHLFDIEQVHIDFQDQGSFAVVPAPPIFSERVPLPDGTVVLEFGQNNTVIAQRTRTAAAPAIAILSPDQNGFMGQPETPVIGWSASDQDSPELYYMVQYSSDGGLSWNTLGTNLTHYALDVYLAELAGSSQAQVKVLASDGFNTTEGFSPFFSVDNTPPSVEILLSDEPIIIEKGQSFSVLGTAFDVEDGMIPEADLLWVSTTDGLIGTGRQIDLIALSTGVHEITLMAEDSNGLLGSEVFVVTVNQPLNRQPKAEAGPDLFVQVGDELTIDGSGSSDQDNDLPTFSWSLNAKPAGSNPVFTSDDTEQAGFIPDITGFYEIGLTVHDGAVGSPMDTMIVHAIDLNTDSDLDGMPDVFEINYDFDRLLPDANLDADNDGFNNGTEEDLGTNPRDPTSYPIIPDIHLVTERVYNQLNPAVAHNSSNDEYLTLWQDYLNYYVLSDRSYGIKIFGRRSGLDGLPVEVEFQVSANDDNNNAVHPDIAYNPVANQYLAVFEYEWSMDDHDIRAQRLDEQGNPIGGIFIVTQLPNFESKPAVAYSPSANEYVVVWEQSAGSGEFIHSDIYGQRISADGIPVASPELIAGDANFEKTPAISCGSTSCLVVMEEIHSGRTDYDIHAQLLTPALSISGAQIPLSTWEYDQLKPRVDFNGNRNEYLVVWEDHHWGWGDDSDIYGSRVTNLGNLLDGSSGFGIAWDRSYLRYNPDVTYDNAADKYLIVWEEYVPPGSETGDAANYNVFLRRLAGSDRSLLDGEFSISNETSYEKDPVIASGTGGRSVAVWEDSRNSATSSTDILSALISLPVGSPEGCDGIDNDLDGMIDEGFADNDFDGLADCIDPDDDNDGIDDITELEMASDPIDPNSTPEICDYVDNDLDGLIDEGYDEDNDGFSSCEGDCSNFNAEINPGVSELCDDIDNDCDGSIDEGFDADNDGFTTCQGDCDDLNQMVNPAGVEVCDGYDNNCNNIIDEGFDLDGNGIADCMEVCGDYLLAAGEQCDDGNLTSGDGCSAECTIEDEWSCTGDPSICEPVCVSSGLNYCDDGNSCTDDSCDPEAGCVQTNNTAPCNDGNSCTVSDVCNSGSCTGLPLDCSDGDACTEDRCNATSGCFYTNNAAACDALLITEIMYNPNNTDEYWEWIELYNRGSAPINLSGFVIDNGDTVGHSSANIVSGSILAGGTAVLYNADNLDRTDFVSTWGGGINLIPVSDWVSMTLNNSSDTVGIWNSFASYDGDHEAHENIVSGVIYGNGSNSWPLSDNAGSIYLKDLGLDVYSGNNWALSADGISTPLGTGMTSYDPGGNSGVDVGSPGRLYGDINGDGDINLEDVIAGLQVLAGQNPGVISLAGEVSGDGEIGHAEVLYVFEYLSNEIDGDGDGYSVNQGDCDDSSSTVNPGATDICGDGIDQDCNGVDC